MFKLSFLNEQTDFFVSTSTERVQKYDKMSRAIVMVLLWLQLEV